MAFRDRHRPELNAVDCSSDDSWTGSSRGAMPQCVLMHESEARAIAGLCGQYAGRETGGDMFGGWTRGGQPHCQLVTGPGPKAICGHGHFAQDVEFLRNTSEVLALTYGIQWLGGFHSHATRGVSGPSAGDIRAVRHLAHQNPQIQSCAEIIVTSADIAPVEAGTDARERSAPEPQGLPRTQLNTFIFTNPRCGVHAPAAVRFLPGVSPIRRAVLADGILDTDAICQAAASFPIDHVVLRAVRTSPIPRGLHPEVSQALVKQIERLPSEVQKHVQLRAYGDGIGLLVPLPKGEWLHILVAHDVSLAARAVKVVSGSAEHGGGITVNITPPSGGIDLARIYCAAATGRVGPSRRKSTRRTRGGLWRLLRRKRTPRGRQ